MSSPIPGALYGIRMNHAAALASTVRDPSPLPEVGPPMRQVAKYERGADAPFRVVHDTTVNRPYGRYAVYIGTHRIGAQLSFPNVDDCRRMESPPALLAPYEERLSKETRMALGILTPGAAPYRRKHGEWPVAASVRRGAKRANAARWERK